jgi:hypothetical protein
MSEYTVPFRSNSSSALVTISGFLAAIAFNVVIATFIFSFWTERGPYHWLAAAQYSMMESYSQKLTLILTIFIFMPLALLLVRPILNAKRWGRIVAFGPFLLLVAAHIIITIYFLCTGGSRSSGTTLNEAVRSATFLPHAVTIDTKFLETLDRDFSTHIAYQGRHNYSSVAYSGSHYIPLKFDSSSDPDMPVIFKSGGFALETLSEQMQVDGMIYKSPLPYLLRRNWGHDDAVFGMIICRYEGIGWASGSFTLFHC